MKHAVEASAKDEAMVIVVWGRGMALKVASDAPIIKPVVVHAVTLLVMWSIVCMNCELFILFGYCTGWLMCG